MRQRQVTEMSTIEIKDCDGNVIEFVEGADLRYANFRGADLTLTILEGLELG
jgi:uncharacterized protein YjbI with pentapeptide repeats